MGHHIDEQGRFQSDRHPDLAPDKIVLIFKELRARRALELLASHYTLADPELSLDIFQRLVTIGEDAP